MAFLLLCACSHTPQTQLLLENWPEKLPASAEIDSVPFHPQQAYQCGPAALATVLGYYNQKTKPEDLISSVYLPERKGSLQIELLATARRYGFVPYSMQANMAHLLKEIAAGNPVLVFQNLAFNWAPQWHFAVAVGYDLPSKTLILRSGPHQRHEISMPTFERTWQRGQSWAYVITPPQQIPATATAHDYLQAVNQLEQAKLTDTAYIAYQHAVQHWPENPLLFMALANTEFQLGQFENAKQHFIAAISVNPSFRQAWNNLAYTLSALQCPREAKIAIHCAATQAPNDLNIQSSVIELNQLIDNGKHCSIPDCR
jgi:tetratricopeptide (TPR) repeat protein